MGLKENVLFCTECWNIAEQDPCGICSDAHRERTQVCVVEDVLDVMALERTSEYKGLYHVLHGVLSPVDGVGPEQLKLEPLFNRVSSEEGEKVTELILATNPSLEGEATALYIQKHLHNVEGLNITRIARGLPMGGDLDYADEVTLSRAMKGRASF